MNGIAAKCSSLELAPDPALPQRDLILDDEQMAPLLASFIGCDGPGAIDTFQKQRIKYRIGESLRVLYRLGFKGHDNLVAARAFAQGKFLGTAAGPNLSRITSQSIDRTDINTIFWLYPDDRKLSHLALLSDAPSMLPSPLGKMWHHSEVMAYVPEKCATVRCCDAGEETIGYAKMYAGGEAESVYQTYRQLASACPQVVKPLGYSELYDLLILKPVFGRRIADLEGSELRDGFAGLGRTLALLHSAPIPIHVPRFRRHDIDRLRNCARVVGSARPNLARLANEIAHELRSTAPTEKDSCVCLHGDVHPKNGIALDGVVTLIDLDQTSFGPAAADLGSMLALLHYNRRVGLITRVTEYELANAFLDAYGSAQKIPSIPTLRWHKAAALLSERALRSVNRIRPLGLSHLTQLLADARRILRTRGLEL